MSADDQARRRYERQLAALSVISALLQFSAMVIVARMLRVGLEVPGVLVDALDFVAGCLIGRRLMLRLLHP